MKKQSWMLSKWTLGLLLVIAISATAYNVWKLGQDKVVQAPAEIEDYLFWQAKELTDFKLTGADNKTLGLNDLKGKWSFIFLAIPTVPMFVPLPWGYWGRRSRYSRKTRLFFRKFRVYLFQ